MAEAARILETDRLAHPMGPSDPTPEQMTAFVEGLGIKEPFARRMLNKPLYGAAGELKLSLQGRTVRSAASSKLRQSQLSLMKARTCHHRFF